MKSISAIVLSSLVAVSIVSCRTSNQTGSLANTEASNPGTNTDSNSLDDRPIIVLVKATIKDGTQTDFLAALPAVMTGTRHEEGNLAYYPHQSLAESTAFSFLEKWENSQALMAHRVQPHVTAFFATIGAFLKAPPAGETFRLVSGTDSRIEPGNLNSEYIVAFSTIEIKESVGTKAAMEAFGNLAWDSREEGGNRGFEVYQSLTDKNKYVTYEIWTDPKAEEMHYSAESSQKFSTVISDAIAHEPVVQHFHVVSIPK